MAHNIETMAYVMRDGRDIPWHKLGRPVDPGQSDARQMIEAAGLNWSVELQRVYLESGREIPNARAIVRDRDGAIFGMATDSYTPLQNVDAFESVSEWMADGRLQFETAGALGNGSRVWGLARIGDDFRVAGKDAIAPYVLLWNGHDGATSLVLKPVVTRVVCANTATVALNERNFRRYSIRHTASIKERVKEASRALGLVRADIYALQEKFDALAQINAGEAELETVASIIAPWPTDPGPDANADARIRYERDRKRAQEERAGLWKVYQYSPTVDRGTRWGVMNAATEYLDWYQERRGQNPNSVNKDWMERRAVYSLEGGQEIRQRIFAALSA